MDYLSFDRSSVIGSSLRTRTIGILTVENLREAIATVFARKGEQVVEANLKAFDAGVQTGTK